MSELKLSGSCLCGAVAYEISGEAGQFWHCHCRRCRKATGTGHATNLIMKPDAASWTAGEELLTSYKVPEAKRFGTTFCSVCGTLMPRFSLEAGFAVVPAGTLDVDPGIKPNGRIFQGSKATWSCEDNELPCHDTYPG